LALLKYQDDIPPAVQLAARPAGGSWSRYRADMAEPPAAAKLLQH